jgi:hypothetical protein
MSKQKTVVEVEHAELEALNFETESGPRYGSGRICDDDTRPFELEMLSAGPTREMPVTHSWFGAQ